MENAQLWLQPLILLTAFIFFWREAKASRRELKDDIREELDKIDARFNRFEDKLGEELGKIDTRFCRIEGSIDARFDRLEDHIREDAEKVDARFDRLERTLIANDNK